MTVAVRLDALVARHAPKMVEACKRTGSWPVRRTEDGKRKDGAPYQFRELGPGRVRLTLETDDGDDVSVVAESKEKAVAALEARG